MERRFISFDLESAEAKFAELFAEGWGVEALASTRRDFEEYTYVVVMAVLVRPAPLPSGGLYDLLGVAGKRVG